MTMRVALMLAVMAGLVWAQDEGKKEEKKADGRKEIRDAAAKALKAAAAKGSAAFEGECSTEYTGEAGGIVVPEGGDFYGGLKGKITGAVEGSFKASFRAKSDKVLYEAWHDKKTVERMTWRGIGMTPGDAANDVLSLVNLEKLAEAAGKAREAKSGEAKLGDAACKTFTLTLDGSAIGKYLDAPEMKDADGVVMSLGMKTSRVELKFWVGDNGLIRKLEAQVAKAFDMSEMIEPGDDGDEEDEDSDGEEMMVTTYTFTFSKWGEAKVEIPEEIREQMTK
jgi:hypothetical protein